MVHAANAAPMERARLRTKAIVLGALLVGIVSWPSPADAHTALVGSDPPDRSSLATWPEHLTLHFAEPVSIGQTSARLVDAAGEVEEALSAVQVSADATVLRFALPMTNGEIHGVVWETYGPDGHRVSGEVVFAVGPTTTPADLADISFGGGGLGDRLSSIGAMVGKVAFIVGTAVLSGTLFLWWVQEAVSGALAVARDRALLVLTGGLGLRWLSSSWRVVGSEPTLATLNEVVTAPLALSSLVAAQACVVAVWVHRRSAPFDPDSIRKAGFGLLAVFVGVASYAYVGHAATIASRPWHYGVGVVHLSAVLLWLGPILVWMMPSTRAVVDAASVARYRATAGWFAAVVLMTGLAQGGHLHGLAPIDAAYGRVLALKVVLVVAVVAPLGWRNHRRIRLRGFAPAHVRLEGVALMVALGLGASLGVMVPTVITRATEPVPLAPVVLESDVAGSIEQCREAELGQPRCYRDWFRSVMLREGVTAAVDQIDASRVDHPFVAEDCHQLAHDLGADAVRHFGSVGAALSFEAANCFSGYYHGVVETALGDLDEADLLAAVQPMCDQPKERRPESFEHFNCLHGIGHGLMLVQEASVFDALSICEEFMTEAEQRMCSSGAFMENVNWAIDGGALPATIDPVDPYYPCNVVVSKFAEDCVLNQTGYWSFGLDISKAEQLITCAGFDSVEVDLGSACARAVGRDANGQSQRDLGFIIDVCADASADYRGPCVWGAAQDLVLLDADPRSADPLCVELDRFDTALAAACRAARDAAGALL